MYPTIIVKDVEGFTEMMEKRLNIKHKDFVDFLNYAYDAGKIDLVLRRTK